MADQTPHVVAASTYGTVEKLGAVAPERVRMDVLDRLKGGVNSIEANVLYAVARKR